MARNCEICAARSLFEGRGAPRKQRLVRLVVYERIIALCEHHAALAKEARTVEDLRGAFSEASGGRRSLVDRRSPLDRRLFPPRPEGRRARPAGRRKKDAN
jgi:hypothetical protein